MRETYRLEWWAPVRAGREKVYFSTVATAWTLAECVLYLEAPTGERSVFARTDLE
jgi:hypothetical protein